MSAELPAHYNILDAFQAFVMEQSLNTENEGQVPYPDEGRHVLAQAFERVLDGSEPEAYAAFKRDDDLCTLIIVGDAAHLVQLDGRTADIRYLGQLRGDYNERVEYMDHGTRVTGRFVHQSLGAFEFTIEPRRPGSHVSPSSAARDEQLARLRRKLLEWRRLPEPH